MIRLSCYTMGRRVKIHKGKKVTLHRGGSIGEEKEGESTCVVKEEKLKKEGRMTTKYRTPVECVGPRN